MDHSSIAKEQPFGRNGGNLFAKEAGGFGFLGRPASNGDACWIEYF